MSSKVISNCGFPSMSIPFVGGEDNIPTLQGHTRHFISQEGYEKWQSTHPNEAHSTSPIRNSSAYQQHKTLPLAPKSSQILQNLPVRQDSSRSNIIDFSAHNSIDLRISASEILEVETRYREELGRLREEGSESLNSSIAPEPLGQEERQKAIEYSCKAEGLEQIIKTFTDDHTRRHLGSLDQHRSANVIIGSLKVFGARRPSMLGNPAEVVEVEHTYVPDHVRRRLKLKNLVGGLLGFGKRVQNADNRRGTMENDSQEALTPELRLMGLVSSKNTQSSMISFLGSPSISNPNSNSDSMMAQSLLAKKFRTSETSKAKSPKLSSISTSSPPLKQPTSAEGIASYLPHTPHDDYRIIRTRDLRSRASQVFSPGVNGKWCSLHRVKDCDGCFHSVSSMLTLDSHKRRSINFPAQGIHPVEGDLERKKRLIEMLDDFIIFSAELLESLRKDKLTEDKRKRKAFEEDVKVEDAQSNSTTDRKGKRKAESPLLRPTIPIQLQLEWYMLFADLITSALLEGYLIDGWKGTAPAEILFGVGCGGWEQTGWVSKPVDENDLSENEIKKRKKLLESAKLLFGQMNQNQSEFERTMRDRTHEFLNIPLERTLDEHLTILNLRYPFSHLTGGVRAFLNDCKHLFGLPELSRYEGSRNSEVDSREGSTLSTLTFSRWMGLLDPDECIASAPTMSSNSRFVVTRTWEL